MAQQKYISVSCKNQTSEKVRSMIFRGVCKNYSEDFKIRKGRLKVLTMISTPFGSGVSIGRLRLIVVTPSTSENGTEPCVQYEYGLGVKVFPAAP